MINSIQEYKYYLKEDEKALGIVVSNFFLKKYLIAFFAPNYILNFQKSMRKCEYLLNTNKRILYIFEKLKYRKLSLKLGFSIPINCFGPGLSIAHYGTIIINPNSKFGKNCRIHACVNIGASSGSKESPQFGNDVYIGPGAIIFGNIYIGNNVKIGANSTVNKDFKDDNILIAGTPAQIIKKDNIKWWEKNKITLTS